MGMKTDIESIVKQALTALKKTAVIPNDLDLQINIERPKDRAHGDFTTNIALALARA